MSKAKTIVTWVLAAIGAIAFLGAGFGKALNTPIVQQLHDAIGAPTWMLIAIGIVEIPLALALLWPKTRWYAAEALAGMMLVATVWHIVAGDFAGMGGSAVLTVLMGTLSWIDRPDWVREKFF